MDSLGNWGLGTPWIAPLYFVVNIYSYLFYIFVMNICIQELPSSNQCTVRKDFHMCHLIEVMERQWKGRSNSRLKCGDDSHTSWGKKRKRDFYLLLRAASPHHSPQWHAPKPRRHLTMTVIKSPPNPKGAFSSSWGSQSCLWDPVLSASWKFGTRSHTLVPSFISTHHKPPWVSSLWGSNSWAHPTFLRALPVLSPASRALISDGVGFVFMFPSRVCNAPAFKQLALPSHAKLRPINCFSARPFLSSDVYLKV